jgi:hypothetical protein
MNNTDKRKLVEYVGLCWHEWHRDTEVDGKIHREQFPKCLKCQALWGNQLDPTNPSDMAKIWKAFKEIDGILLKFEDWMFDKYFNFDGDKLFDILTDTSKSANALLEYIKDSS